jgi:hypothetical protein
MEVALKEIHIGNEIERRINELGIARGEFAKRAGIPQQHVYRVFERDTIEVKKLIRICKVLDFNFFSLFCEQKNNITAFLSSINFGHNGKSETILSPEAAAAQLLLAKSKYEDAQAQIRIFDKMSTQMSSQLEDKERLLEVKCEQVDLLKSENAKLNDENARLREELAALKR